MAVKLLGGDVSPCARDPFDVMQYEMQVDEKKIITLAIEEKSLWPEETPSDIPEILGEMDSKLRKTVEAFREHAGNAGDEEWIVPKKGYAIVIYINPGENIP